MDQISVKARKWGNSFGIVLPKSIVDKENIDEGTDLIIHIKTKKRTTGEDIAKLSKSMNIIERLNKIDTQKALKKIDEVFWSE